MTCRSPVVRRSRAFSGMDFRTADVRRRCIVRGASEGVPTKNAVRLVTEPAGIGSIHRVRRRFVPFLRRSSGAACQLPSTALAAGHTVSSPHVPRTSLVLVAGPLAFAASDVPVPHAIGSRESVPSEAARLLYRTPGPTAPHGQRLPNRARSALALRRRGGAPREAGSDGVAAHSATLRAVTTQTS